MSQGYTFLISCFVIELVILVQGLFELAEAEPAFHEKILLTVTSLVRGLFASGAVMISFGAVLGRTSPKQLMLMAFLEVRSPDETKHVLRFLQSPHSTDNVLHTMRRITY